MVNNLPPHRRLRRPLGTFQEDKKHPSWGGNAYSQEVRGEVMTRYMLGLPLETPELQQLRAVYAFPSMVSCERWIKQYHALGHWNPKEPTGNHEAERQVLGQPLVRLALYRLVHPETSVAHVQAFLFNMDPTVPPYTPQAIIRAEKLLDLCRKASSTTCERAYWPINLHKRNMFWDWDYPFGRANVSTRDMIDLDESGMKIEASNPSFGKSVSFHRCHFEGAYNRERKLNLIMAISADPDYDFEWHEHWEQEEGGTNLYRMYTFIEGIINQLAIDRPGRSFCFTMDNLNVHHHPILLDLITSRGHRYLFRAPYWSVDGPMEYIFNAIHTHLLMHFRGIEDLAALGNRLDVIIPQLNGFLKYFLHVGFPDN